jgi:hypothetical protein
MWACMTESESQKQWPQLDIANIAQVTHQFLEKEKNLGQRLVTSISQSCSQSHAQDLLNGSPLSLGDLT